MFFIVIHTVIATDTGVARIIPLPHLPRAAKNGRCSESKPTGRTPTAKCSRPKVYITDQSAPQSPTAKSTLAPDQSSALADRCLRVEWSSSCGRHQSELSRLGNKRGASAEMFALANRYQLRRELLLPRARRAR